MVIPRRAENRGHAEHGWLTSHHTFSFADYLDPREMGFGPLRVINDDLVQPGMGFGAHAHRDMEIITYVLDGALEHKDSMGNGSVIRRGQVQRMSAGTGVRHSEFNPSPSEPVHFLQIWIEPDRRNVAPGYEELDVSESGRRGQLRLVASPDGADGSATIHQDARVYATLLNGAERVEHAIDAGRRCYVHVARGTVSVNGEKLSGGDGARITDESQIVLADAKNAEVLLFDLP